MKKLFVHKAPAILCLIVFFFIIVQASFYFDPDFWWHLKVGEIISKFGIPRVDPFSYTMPSFHVVSHEWLVDTAMFFLYQHAGYFILAVLFSVLASLALSISWIDNSFKQNKNFNSALFFIFCSVVLTYMGVRVQVFSWLFLALLAYLVRKLESTKSKKLYLGFPVLFFVWANIHGSFAAGIAFLGLYTLGKTIRTRKIDWLAVGALALSIIITLINPYGIGLWREIWLSFSDSQLRWRISEWNPSITNFVPAFVFFVSFSLAIIYRSWKKINLEYKLIFIFFLFQAVVSTRHVPLFAIVTMPVILQASNLFYHEISKNKISLKRFNKIASIALIFAIVLFLFSFLSNLNLFRHLDRDFYPVEAISYLRGNLDQGNIFSEYGWGGYLIWNLPEKKVFIDGRMPSWRWEANIDDETNNAMDDYMDVLSGKLHFKVVAEKYNINTVLWPRRNISKPETNAPSLEASLYKWVTGSEFYRFSLTQDLEKNLWQKVYEDDVAVIYKRPN